MANAQDWFEVLPSKTLHMINSVNSTIGGPMMCVVVYLVVELEVKLHQLEGVLRIGSTNVLESVQGMNGIVRSTVPT